MEHTEQTLQGLVLRDGIKGNAEDDGTSTQEDRG
jgi:hypothetical protein